MTLEKLTDPPIVEVVCGFAFSPLPLDPLIVGTYWDRRRSDYPKRDLQPPVADTPQIFHGVGPIRCWLISADEAFLLQIQHDRFYLNWRRRGGEYPRFSDHESKPPGILSRALKEFSHFQDFCQVAVDCRPEPARIDLAKIDHLVEGRHWSGLRDLADAVPWLKSFAGFSGSDNPDIALRFVEQLSRGILKVSLDTARIVPNDAAPVRLIKLETRISSIVVDDTERDFRWANGELNNVFAALVPSDQRLKRFNK